MLTAQEKEDLYLIISSTIGHDAAIKQRKPLYNEQTIEVTEQMVNAIANCNSNMKSLIAGLVDGPSVLAKGALRKLLRRFSRALNNDSTKIKGYACLVVAKSHWKREILVSTMGA